MSLPASWVEEIFTRLTLRYGAAFQRQYADLDLSAVKADWADCLACFTIHPRAIAYALDNLPDRAPNAGQFKALGLPMLSAERMPPPMALEAPPADQNVVASAMVAMRDSVAPKAGRSLAQECIDNIERLIANGLRPTPAHRAMLEACRKVVGEPA